MRDLDKYKEKFLNKKFGRLQFNHIYLVDNNVMCDCSCDCGELVTKNIRHLNFKRELSCGCAKIQMAMKRLNDNRFKIRKHSHEMGLASILLKSRYVDSDLDLKEFFDLIKKPCFYCGVKPNQVMKPGSRILNRTPLLYNGLDRIDNNLPHNKDNVVPACAFCNCAKRSRNINDFYLWIETVSSNMNFILSVIKEAL